MTTRQSSLRYATAPVARHPGRLGADDETTNGNGAEVVPDENGDGGMTQASAVGIGGLMLFGLGVFVGGLILDYGPKR